MKILICGSRDLTYKQVYPVIDEHFQLWKEEFPETDFEIISGGARGVDNIAESYARNNNHDLTVMHANWNKYGKSAGPLRNERMVRYCDQILAIWDGKSRGTQSTINLAKQYDKPYQLVIATSNQQSASQSDHWIQGIKF